MVSGQTLETVRRHLAVFGHRPTLTNIADALRETGQVVSQRQILDIFEGISRDSLGLGVLDQLLDIDGVTDIVVNGPNQVFFDCGQGLEPALISFSSDDEVRQLGVRLAASVGRRLDDGSPFVDARLHNGVRFHGVLAGISHPGTCLSLRIPAKTCLSLEDWESGGGVDRQAGMILRRIVDLKVAFLISGGTGSGKTTLLGSLLSLVPPSERLVVVEDSRELDPSHPHLVSLESRPANGEEAGRVTMTDLVRQALRMRPDRLVVGEVRGAELRDLLQALNTGHEGGCGTIHANSIGDIPARLEALGALSGLSPAATHAQVVSAIRVVIHVVRRGPVREVSQIGVLVRGSSDRLESVLAWSRCGQETQRGPGWDLLGGLLS